MGEPGFGPRRLTVSCAFNHKATTPHFWWRKELKTKRQPTKFNTRAKAVTEAGPARLRKAGLGERKHTRGRAGPAEDRPVKDSGPLGPGTKLGSDSTGLAGGMGDLIRCDHGSYEELKKNIKQLHCMSGETEAPQAGQITHTQITEPARGRIQIQPWAAGLLSPLKHMQHHFLSVRNA